MTDAKEEETDLQPPPEHPAAYRSGASEGSNTLTEIDHLEPALLRLEQAGFPELSLTLARLFVAVATEAARTPRFAKALTKALVPSDPPATPANNQDRPRRTNRRAPGAIDPFSIYAEASEAGLRERLADLDIEQLKDIIAEHGMDQDRLAMKWKDRQRISDRIVERVAARTAKGSAFRRPTESG